MRKILLIGNPNVGKSTLFNSLTKSSEHTGNFHGVTVEEKRKIVKFKGEEYEFVDLPGMYSLNSFTDEEKVARDIAINDNACRVILTDANNIRRNLYLALQLNELNLEYTILINNYDYFLRHGNKINITKLRENIGKNVEIINAKKIRLNDELINKIKSSEIRQKNYNIDNYKQNDNNITYFDKTIKNTLKNNYLLPIITEIRSKINLDERKIILGLNGVTTGLKDNEIECISSFLEQAIEARYNKIDEILNSCLEINENYTYGVSKLDKFLLNPAIMGIGFFAFFLLSIYVIFFLVGPLLSDGLIALTNFLIITPFMNIMYLITDNIWLLEFFSNGVFSSFTTVLSFLPQICLLFIFLTILEDSGLISRLAYVFDDFLSKIGLNGKAIYIMLMGLGCNTMSSMASRNMNGKNLKTKIAIINPFISCMARLPVFVIVASAFFGANAYFVVAGLYLLGLIVALIMAGVLNKTMLPTKSSELLLEFPPIRNIDIKHILTVARVNAVDFFKRVFGVVLSVGIIVWILSHTTFNLSYTEIISDSVLFIIADKIAFIFAPIGLNSAGIVCALVVGIMAKELILSIMSISNNALTNTALMTSLLTATSVIHFNLASAVSFLLFSLLYAPCISTLAVIKKEAGRFYMWFTLISQFTIAYLFSFVAYQSITHGVGVMLAIIGIIALIMFAIIFIVKKIRHKKISCLFCNKCKR